MASVFSNSYPETGHATWTKVATVQPPHPAMHALICRRCDNLQAISSSVAGGCLKMCKPLFMVRMMAWQRSHTNRRSTRHVNQ
jgi:hypothetical protein